MIRATIGILASSAGGFDADAQAFFTRVTDAGGSLSTTEQDAVNTLVVQMKDDGIWTKMKAIYPMVGASAAACAQNLKSSSFTGTFTATGWTFASTGATPNGTSAYMDTGLNMADILSQNNTHISAYVRNDLFSGVAIGATSSTFTSPLYIFPKLLISGFTRAYFSAFDNSSNCFTSTSNSLGLLTTSRQISTNQKYYQNGSLKSNQLFSSVSPISANVFIGALNRGGVTITNYSAYELALASIGDGLSDTEASDLYTAVQAFQTTLNRQV